MNRAFLFGVLLAVGRLAADVTAPDAGSSQDGLRTWTSNDGKTISARETGLSESEQTVILETPDGKVFQVPLTRLSKADAALALAWNAAPQISLHFELSNHEREKTKISLKKDWKKYLAEYASSEQAEVSVQNLENAPLHLGVRYIFFSPLNAHKPAAPRDIVVAGHFPIDLDPGTATDVSVFGTAAADVQNYSALHLRLVDGGSIETFAVVVEDAHGKPIAVKSTLPEIEDYVNNNYDYIVSRIGAAQVVKTVVVQTVSDDGEQ
jgi:hypothetical protein